MKLRFSWEEAFGDLFPHCSSDVVNEDGTSLLSCILTDDGGCQLIHSLKWIDVGLARIKSVKESKVEFDHWDREVWGADFSKDCVKLYFRMEEDYCEFLSLESFEKALMAWRDFIELPPDKAVTRELEI
ncbi:hypothetical protein [Pseudomonas sp. CH235]|uniref:hypothetical protein n=1 Tax=Pseudomonas sp. CH235 TaxID=1634006 RepID=UPI00106378B1|nr:hypothetical protein [Pseudomonas sp. CH235]TEA60475.1 hypothetical protein EIY71_17385 [Pseudomonas sp. CH235]